VRDSTQRCALFHQQVAEWLFGTARLASYHGEATSQLGSSDTGSRHKAGLRHQGPGPIHLQGQAGHTFRASNPEGINIQNSEPTSHNSECARVSP
jgi:hypothetical protein